MSMIEQFKDKFRIERDQQGDPLIRCRNGFLYEGGPSWLGLWLETARPTATLKAIQVKFPAVTMAQCGEGECVLRYPVAGLKADVKFLAAVGAHRRRKLTPEHRERLIEVGKGHRFEKQHGSGSADSRPGLI